MFTDIGKATIRGPGRPPGRTARGERTRQRLYEVATRQFAELGYERTTLRGIAREAGVSPGLLYKYFPSKSAVVMTLYDQLSRTFEARAATVAPGSWAARFATVLRHSLEVLGPHRSTLRAVMPLMLVDAEFGLFSEEGAPARRRVRARFVAAVAGARNRPAGDLAAVVGRLLDLAQLGLILFWLLDRSRKQRATAALLNAVPGWTTTLSALLWLPGLSGALTRLDQWIEDGLYGADAAIPRENVLD